VKRNASPTQLTLSYLRKRGIPCVVVEHWVKFGAKGGIRRDKWGADIQALTVQDTIGIQAGMSQHLADKIKKAGKGDDAPDDDEKEQDEAPDDTGGDSSDAQEQPQSSFALGSTETTAPKPPTKKQIAAITTQLADLIMAAGDNLPAPETITPEDAKLMAEYLIDKGVTITQVPL